MHAWVQMYRGNMRGGRQGGSMEGFEGTCRRGGGVTGHIMRGGEGVLRYLTT